MDRLLSEYTSSTSVCYYPHRIAEECPYQGYDHSLSASHPCAGRRQDPSVRCRRKRPVLHAAQGERAVIPCEVLAGFGFTLFWVFRRPLCIVSPTVTSHATSYWLFRRESPREGSGSLEWLKWRSMAHLVPLPPPPPTV